MSFEHRAVAGLQVWLDDDVVVEPLDVAVRFLGSRGGHVPSWGEVRTDSRTISWGREGVGATSAAPRGPGAARLWGWPLAEREAVVFAAPDRPSAVVRARLSRSRWFPRAAPDPDDVEVVDALWLDLGGTEGDPPVRHYGLTFAGHVLEWIGPPSGSLHVVRRPPPRFPPDGDPPHPAVAVAAVPLPRRRPVWARGIDLPRPAPRPRRESSHRTRTGQAVQDPSPA